MSNRLFAALFGTAVISAVISAVLAAPAKAADDTETKAQVCATCHGQNGVPINATTPIIWGQQSNYLYKELHDFHSGDRNSPIMAPLVHGIALDDLRKLANYIAAKTWPARQAAAAAPADAAPPAAIADKLGQCQACHQKNFEGGAPAPRLAGLSYQYLLTAMNNFADGKRTNNLDMPGFMRALTESERDAMAKYLAGL